MALGRKAVFFSMTSLLIVGAMLVMFAPEDTRTVNDAAYNRIQDLTQDRAQLEERVLPIVLRSHVRKSLNEIARKTIDDPGYALNETELITEVDNCLEEQQETKDQELLHRCAQRTQETTFDSTISKIEQQYRDSLQHQTTITLHEIQQIEHLSPWEIAVTANISVQLNDTANIARFDRTRTIRTIININGLLDPLATNASGQPRTIKRDTSNNWTPQTLANHAINGTYVYNQQAPSYLQRLGLQANENSPFGIHSLVPSSDNTKNAADYDSTNYNPDCLLDIQVNGQTIHLTETLAEYYRVFDQTGQTGYNPEACT